MFGKKFVERFGKDEEIEISIDNIQAAIETFLRAVRKLKDSDEIFSIILDDVVGKKPGEVVRIVIKKKNIG